MKPSAGLNLGELHDLYAEHLTVQVLPFWQKAIDKARGGVFTGFDPAGAQLVHRDKFTWSQGRFLWLWSRLSQDVKQGKLPGAENVYMEQAGQLYRFLRDHAFLPNGNCAFLLTEDGEPKESRAGEGLDASFYADCFVVMGFAAYAQTSGEGEALELAADLYDRVRRRLAEGSVRSEPYPIPDGYRSHGFAMIMLNTSQVLADACQEFDSGEEPRYREQSLEYAREILGDFCDERFRVREVIPAGDAAAKPGPGAPEALLLRHLNPGHTVESMWFVLEEAARHGDTEMIGQACRVLLRALESGWDPVHGGLLRYIDLDGGEPLGKPLDAPGADRFETLIRTTWDMKLWWPHSEGLYATLLAYRLTGDEAYAAWHQRLLKYTLNTFPADPGREWIQIRSRAGAPVDQVVALPVKDPYHIARNLLLLIELTRDATSKASQ